MSKCKSCGADVLWVLTQPANKAMPVDRAPVPNGNLRLVEASSKTWAYYVTAEKPAPEGALLYVSHFATCPQGKSHRKEA